MKVGSEAVGVALAGGASRRLGRDKTAIRLGGATLVERAVATLSSVCAEVVVADRGRRSVEGAVSVDDGLGDGPAAGILGAAAALPGRDLLVLACDLPRVPAALLAALLVRGAADWVVPVHGAPARLEPLCALYRRRALAALGEQVRRGVFAVHRLAAAPGLAVHRVDEAALAAFGRPDELFLNVNTPADLLLLQGEETGG